MGHEIRAKITYGTASSLIFDLTNPPKPLCIYDCITKYPERKNSIGIIKTSMRLMTTPKISFFEVSLAHHK
jgi:hypothetical protein